MRRALSIEKYGTTFTDWIQSLWGDVPSQNIPPSVSGSSASLVEACWEKLLPLLPWCSVSNPPLSLVSFHITRSWDILRGRSIVTRDTRSDEYWSADEISSGSRQNRCFWNPSPQRKPDALQTSTPWQLKCFEFTLEGCSRTNSPYQWFHTQLCY
jgi:hypothetical protein